MTRDVLLPFSFTPAADGHHATLAGATTIRRLDFGVGQGEWTDTTWVGNEVKIRFELRLASPDPHDLALILRCSKSPHSAFRNSRVPGIDARAACAASISRHNRTNAGGPHVIPVHGAVSALVLPFVVALAITACQKKTEPAAEAPAAAAGPAADPLEGQVDIVAWPGYIERGDTDKNYDWVTAFEKESGCKVNVKTAGTSDEMVSLMTQGGYDLVTASGDASLRLIRGGTVQPVDIGRVPSYANVDKRLKEAPWHIVDGKHYGTPYQWGPNVLMYNTKVFKTPPNSWSVVFEPQKLPDGKPNKGRIQAYDGPIYIADAALYLMAKKPELGIKDPYQLNEEQYKAALDCCASSIRWCTATGTTPTCRCRTSPTRAWWPRVVAVPGQHPDRQQAADRVRRPGGRRDRMGGHDDARTAAKHPVCAYSWLEWSLNPKVQGDVASWFGSLPAVPAACEGNALLGTRAARPTASTTSTGSTSGAPRKRDARREPASRIAAGCKTTSG